MVITLLIITRLKNKPKQYILTNDTFLPKCYITKLRHLTEIIFNNEY